MRQFFNHALDLELIHSNPFARPGSEQAQAPHRPPRLPDHHSRAVRAACADALARAAPTTTGCLIEGAILAVGEAAIRPSEVFTLHRDEVDFAENVIHIRWQILDSEHRQSGCPPSFYRRWLVMSPTLRGHLRAMPAIQRDDPLPGRARRLHDPAYNWHHHWHAVRASAGMPGQEFDQLKHRAIQWMVDPVEDGDLGLDPPTVAQMVGHDDAGGGGGYLDRHRLHQARGATTPAAAPKRAMDAYQERIAANNGRTAAWSARSRSELSPAVPSASATANSANARTRARNRTAYVSSKGARRAGAYARSARATEVAKNHRMDRMNAERLHAIANAIYDEMSSDDTVGMITGLRDNLRQSMNEPNQPGPQQQVSTLRTQVERKGSRRHRATGFRPRGAKRSTSLELPIWWGSSFTSGSRKLSSEGNALNTCLGCRSA